MGNLGEEMTEDEVQYTPCNAEKMSKTNLQPTGIITLQVEAMIEEADIDGDGSINYAEFFVMVGKTLAKMGRE